MSSNKLAINLIIQLWSRLSYDKLNTNNKVKLNRITN